MTAMELRKNRLTATAAVAAAMEDPGTHDYLKLCLDLFYSGMYGKIPDEDRGYNDAELKTGEGRIVARYEAQNQLREDIYIIAYFSESEPVVDCNYTTILYVSEY